MSLKKNCKRIFFLVAVCLSILSSGCETKNEHPVASKHDSLQTEGGALQFLIKAYDTSAKNAFYKPFSAEQYAIAYLDEVNNVSDWGIRFVLLKPIGDTLETAYESSVLEVFSE